MKSYKRENFCGPAGDGPLSKFLSWGIKKILDFFNLKVQRSCKKHDINWEDGPKTVDDIRFAADVYEELTDDDRHEVLAAIVAIIGFFLVRCTAIVYKHL